MTAGGLFLAFFCFVGVLATGAFLYFLAKGYLERRAHDAFYKAELARFEARPRAKILSIGGTVRDCLGREHATDFELDCLGEIPARSVGLHGELLIGGYTREELVEISKRRKEFEP